MLTVPRDPTTVDRLQELLDGIFTTRDQFYAAADSLADGDERYICRWLGNRLGGHAADLQQIITASGVRPTLPQSQRDRGEIFETIQTQAGDRGVLNAVNRVEQLLTEKYDRTIERVADQQVAGLLSRQREESQFADCVLRKLKPPA